MGQRCLHFVLLLQIWLMKITFFRWIPLVNLQETAIDLKGLLDHQILSSRDAPHTSGAELMKGNWPTKWKGKSCPHSSLKKKNKSIELNSEVLRNTMSGVERKKPARSSSLYKQLGWSWMGFCCALCVMLYYKNVIRRTNLGTAGGEEGTKPWSLER